MREEGLEAALTSDPLLGIINGDFSIADNSNNNLGWQNRGDSIIDNGQAVLTEDSPFHSNVTQTFTIPEDANNLQFTLVDLDLSLTIPKKTKRLNYRGIKAYNLMKMLLQSDKNQNENQNLRHNPKFLHQI